jgi:hypothetical protein
MVNADIFSMRLTPSVAMDHEDIEHQGLFPTQYSSSARIIESVDTSASKCHAWDKLLSYSQVYCVPDINIAVIEN